MREDSSPQSLRDRGRAILIASLVTVGLLGSGMLLWLLTTAQRHPDVQAKRPGWLDASAGFEISFWIPLVLTVGVGAFLVCLVFVRALSRLNAGYDLYANRYGRGLRRRGENHLEDR